MTPALLRLQHPHDNLLYVWIERLFDAFFTTKQQKGSGVGQWLTIVVLQEHGGKLQLRSSTRLGASGTCISVLLPV